jgi:hypothetical protein
MKIRYHLKKASRKWEKENRRKERDARNITSYLKGTYEIRQITEEEKIERKKLRKITMFEIFINIIKYKKLFLQRFSKENQSHFIRTKRSLHC